MTATRIFRSPFEEVEGVYIISSNHVITFTILNPTYVERALNLINGQNDTPFEEVMWDRGVISINGIATFLMRGWGHLTGAGALNLPIEDAARIQDEFCDWTVAKLAGDKI